MGKYSSNLGSKFWLDEFDTTFTRWDDDGQTRTKKVDYTKLASTQRAIGNFVNIVTGKQIPVQFQTAESSYTDGKTVTIGTKIEGNDFDPAVGLALHEGSHIAFTDFNIIKDFKRIGGSFHTYVTLQGCDPDLNMTANDLAMIKDILNWVEDRRIDYHVYTTAPGYRVYYEAMYDKYFNDKIIDKALQENVKTNETWDDYLFHLINFTNPNRNLDSLTALRSIWNLIDLKNINRLTSTQDALQLSCGIYNLIKAAVDANPGSVSDDTADKSDSDDVEYELTEGTDNGNGQSSPLSEAQQKKLEKAIEKQREFISNTDELKKGKLSKKDGRVVETLKNAGTEDRIVDASIPDSYGSNSPACPLNTIVIKKFSPAVIMTLSDMFNTNAAEPVFLKGKDPLKDWRYKEQNKHVTAGIILGRALGRKLQIRNEERTLKSTRLNTGKVDRRLISSLGFGNDSVFHRIVTDKYKNFFIHISIDASGSMEGPRFNNAIKSAVAVAKAASMTTGIRVQISLRGTTGSYGNHKSTTLYAYDSAHDKMSKIKTLFPWLQTFGMTPEGIAFESIMKDIKKDAKGDECIFINYSDGAPGGVDGTSYYWDGVEFTRRAVNKMRGLGMNIISYFIDSKSDSYLAKDFRKMYGPEAEFIDSTSLIEMSKSLNRKFIQLGDAV